jgi:tetratricopeptide (TPR) repeat protein
MLLEACQELIRQTDSSFHKIRLSSVFFKYYFRQGDQRTALTIAQQTEAIASEIDDPFLKSMVDANLALTYHLTGNLESARKHCQSAMLPIGPRAHSVQTLRFAFDYRVAALCAWARNSLLTGQPELAAQQSEQALDWAGTLQNPVIVCISLVWAISINLLLGNVQKAQNLTEKLTEHSQDFSITPYMLLSRGFRGAILSRRGNTGEGIQMIELSLQQARAINSKLFTSDLSGYLAEALVEAGRHEEAFSVLERTFESVDVNGDSFILAELLRVKGVIATKLPASAMSPETCFLESIAIAKSQNALSWELRTSISLAKHLMVHGRRVDAASVLRKIHQRFDEGFATADLLAASQLLGELDHGSAAPLPRYRANT